ncbi:MAG: hypothetical protein QOI23_2289 [Chloroflexota bacterium]|jgi:hypothetical protein|nr:hypothetical protein [Chloroflexota bacterium]
MPSIASLRWIVLLVALAVSAACGLNGSPTATTSPGVTTSPQQSPDPGNVVWITYSGQVFALQYPEGWVRNVSASGAAATFSNKDSYVSVQIVPGSAQAPTTQSVTSEIAGISGAKVTAAARQVALPAGAAINVSYEVLGPADPVTGKQPRLVIDRYEMVNSGRVAILELAAQVGIDKVSAYLAIANSFKWTS